MFNRFNIIIRILTWIRSVGTNTKKLELNESKIKAAMFFW